jgi:RHS repeat-associated protein
LTSIEDQAGTVSFTYNESGWLTEETRQFTGVSGTLTTEYEYDYDGRLTSIVYPSGRVVTLTYAVDNGLTVDRLSGLTMSTVAGTAATVTLLSGIVDNAAGQLTQRALGNGAVTESRTFNGMNQLTGIAAAADSVTLLSLAYGYGTANNGRIRARADALNSDHSVAYGYDGLQRLTGVTAQDESWSIGWQFDEYGNRLHQNATGWAANRVANATNRSFDGNNRFDETGYAYDEAGNVTQVPSGGGTAAFAYDGEGRLTAVNTDQVQYVYDYAGRRVKRMTAQETRYDVYGLTGLMSEFTTADSGLTDERAAYVIPEHNGTGVLFVGGDGAVIESNRTLPFGELWEDNANSANVRKFTTYDRDPDTGLDYAMARHYSSKEGRFLSPDPGHVGADPGNPQSWNAYVYVLNDPTNSTDPTGMFAFPWGALIPEAGLSFGSFGFSFSVEGEFTSEIFESFMSEQKSGADYFKELKDKDIKDGLNQAKLWLMKPKCDGALAGGNVKENARIPSLLALVSQIRTGPRAGGGNIFDGRKHPYFAKNPNVPAFVDGGITLLGPKYFNPAEKNLIPSTLSTKAQAVILIHEPVHAFGGKLDSDYGSSRGLSTLIINACEITLRDGLAPFLSFEH